MKTHRLIAAVCLVFVFCAIAMAKEVEKFPFKQTRGEVAETPSRSWANFTVGSFKLIWNSGDERITFIGIQHFQFCLVSPEQMKFEEITNPTQFLYRSLEQSAVINQSTKEPSKRTARFPTSPMLPVPNSYTLMLQYHNKYLALGLLKNTPRYNSFEEMPESLQEAHRKRPERGLADFGKPKSLVYRAKLWQNAVAEKDAFELQVEVDEATGIKTARIPPKKEFYIPDIGKCAIFKWNPKPYINKTPGYEKWVQMDYEISMNSAGGIWWANAEEREIEDIKNPFSCKFEKITCQGPIAEGGIQFPPPQEPSLIRFLKVDKKCMAMKVVRISDEKIVFRWKVFSEEQDKVAARATQNR